MEVLEQRLLPDFALSKLDPAVDSLALAKVRLIPGSADPGGLGQFPVNKCDNINYELTYTLQWKLIEKKNAD